MIYFVQCGKNGPIKIGCTGSVEDRVAQMQTSSPYKLSLLWQIKGGKDDEMELHKRWKHEKIRGEWFHPSRELLNFIETEAASEWGIKFEDGGLEVEETKRATTVGGAGWSLVEIKGEFEIHILVDDYHKIFLDLGDNQDSFEVFINKTGIEIEAEGSSMFGGTHIKLGGKKTAVNHGTS